MGHYYLTFYRQIHELTMKRISTCSPTYNRVVGAAVAQSIGTWGVTTGSWSSACSPLPRYRTPDCSQGAIARPSLHTGIPTSPLCLISLHFQSNNSLLRSQIWTRVYRKWISSVGASESNKLPAELHKTLLHFQIALRTLGSLFQRDLWSNICFLLTELLIRCN